MIIVNNLSAMQTMHQLDQNTKKAAGFAKQLSSGERINSAGDGASEYAISEKMKIEIRTFTQCSDNAKNGISMIDSASAAVDQQVNIMKKVRELAMKAANDTCTNQDRKILQTEVGQMLDQSEDIAQSTTFNGKPLLNKAKFSREDKNFNALVPYRDNPNHEQVLKFPSDTIATVSADGKTSGTGVPFGSYTAITTTPSNTYDFSAVVKGTALTAMPSVNTVIWDDARGTYGRVEQDTNDHAFYVNSTAGKTLIAIQGISNGLYAVPTATHVSTAVYAPTTSPAVGGAVALSATPAFDSNTPPAVVAPTSYPVKNAPGSGLLSYFDSLSSESSMEIDFSGVFPLSVNGSKDLDGIGFSTACNGCDQFVTIQFDASTDVPQSYENSSGKIDPPPLCYVIGVKSVTDSNSLMEAIFNGVTATAHAGGGTLPSATDTSTQIAARHDIKFNYYAATGKMTISKNGPEFVFNNGIMGAMEKTDYFKPAQTLDLQLGDESSQYTNMSIPNTTLSIMFPSDKSNWDITPQDSDYPSEWPNGYDTLTDAQKREKWQEEAWGYPSINGGVDEKTCVSTRGNATKFLGQVDQAVKYLLSSNTTLGAQSSRLKYTGENLDTSITNQTASESAIRDTNMAMAMLSYTKENTLTQLAQSMLAQANQLPSRVLSLLQ
ncbi:MAG: flagellin [Selenomonadaceae bacterium]